GLIKNSHSFSGGRVPKVTEEHKQSMRRRIQDAALSCFARKGFSGASMADIVKEAGLSAGAVYVYYASKSELMVDVGRRAMEPRIAVLETARTGSEVAPPSAEFIELLASLLIVNPFSSIILQTWAAAPFDEEFAGFAATFFVSLVDEFTVYLASYLHEARGAAFESAREQAEALVPAILA